MFLQRLLIVFFACWLSTNVLSEITHAEVKATSFDNSLEKDAPSNKLILELCPTYGELGPRRPAILIAGENLNVAILVSGLSVGADGILNYSTSYEIRNSNGERISPQGNENCIGKSWLGGSSVKHNVTFPFGRDIAPGNYRFYVAILDQVSNRKEEKELQFTILSKSTFGILDLKISHDANKLFPCGGNVSVGEFLFLTGSVGGVKNDNGNSHMTVTLTIHDSQNHSVSDAMTSEYDKNNPTESDLLIPFFYKIPAHRSGNFILRLEAKDVIADKKVTADIPINILSPPRNEEAEKIDKNKEEEKSGTDVARVSHP